MLPGFRFLLTAITLSTSMLVFGLGAASLLRAAHEQFASNPSWHAAPEATFAQQAEPVTPVLAMLRAEPTPAEPKAPDHVSVNIPTATPPPEQAAAIAPEQPTAASPAAPEQVSVVPAASEPEQRLATLTPEQSSPPEPANAAEPSVADDAAPDSPAPSQNEVPITEVSGSATPASESDSTLELTKQAALAPVVPQANETVANETAPTQPASAEGETDAAAASQAGAATSLEIEAISTRFAAPDGRPLIVLPRPRPKAAIARAEQAAKMRLERQAALRRKLAAQARQATLFPFAPFTEPLNQSTGVAPKY